MNSGCCGFQRSFFVYEYLPWPAGLVFTCTTGARDLSGGKPYSESHSGHNLKEAKAMKWNRAILAFLVFVFAGLIAYAAQQFSQSKMGQMSCTRSVTGCLQK